MGRGNKNPGISESKARIEGGSTAPTRPLPPPPLFFPEHEIVRPGPRRQGIGFASLRALDGSGPSLGGSLFMRKRGELQRGRESTRTGLHKGAVLQQSGPGRVFKGLGVAKRYCGRGSIGDSFVQTAMIEHWTFARGGAWRNPKPTGGLYICEQCRLAGSARNVRTYMLLLAVAEIELAPYGCMRQLRGAVVGGTGTGRSTMMLPTIMGQGHLR